MSTFTVAVVSAGRARHALVADQEMRPLFAFTRIDRAARELLLLMESGFARAVREGPRHRSHAARYRWLRRMIIPNARS